MAAQEEEPDWLSLPSDLLKIISRRSRDAVTGLTAFRSVCRAWRAASGPAPRLLIPRPGAVRLIFPLSRGWSIVFYQRGFFDFAYHDGRMFAMHINGEMAVFDAGTLHALQLVQRPPATPHLGNRMHGTCCLMKEFNYAHLVALPGKLVLLRTTIKSSRPVAFSIFQLASKRDGRLLWRKVNDAGDYELFVDGYHTTFRENGGDNGGGGTWIYYVHETPYLAFTAAYRYSMRQDKLKCVYTSPKGTGPSTQLGLLGLFHSQLEFN